MNWNEALANLQLGKRIARAPWVTGSYLMLVQPPPATVNGKMVIPPKQVGKISNFNEGAPVLLDNGVSLDVVLSEDIFRTDWHVVPNPNVPDGTTIFAFGAAIRRLNLLTRTTRVQRADWAPGEWLILIRAGAWTTNLPETSGLVAQDWFGKRTADGTFGPWLPSTGDMQATNWREVLP